MTTDESNITEEVIVYPRFRGPKELNIFLRKFAWYFASVASDNLRIYFDSKYDINWEYNCDFLDPETVAFLQTFSALFRRYKSDKIESFRTCSKKTILLWDNRQLAHLKHLGDRKCIYDVDDLRQRYAASNFTRASCNLIQHLPAKKATYDRRISQFLERHTNEVVYLLGTGPNLSQYKNYTLRDEMVIACNSIVKNKDILQHTQPNVIVAADPVFHTGPSKYAAQFRTDLANYLAENKASMFIAPLHQHHLYQSLINQGFEEQLGFVECLKTESINLDLRQEKRIEPTDNILTLLMLPIASSIGKDLRLIGFDGSKSKPLLYFWKHNKDAQYKSLIKTAKKTHPSFFKRSYTQYYEKHSNTLSDYVNAIRNSGKTLKSLTETNFSILNDQQKKP